MIEESLPPYVKDNIAEIILELRRCVNTSNGIFLHLKHSGLFENKLNQLLEEILPWVSTQKLLKMSARKPITGLSRVEEILKLLQQ